LETRSQHLTFGCYLVDLLIPLLSHKEHKEHKEIKSFGTPIAKQKSANFFSLKIKSLEKQKCEYKLFLSKSKILYRLNHRITENWQKIVTKKILI